MLYNTSRDAFSDKTGRSDRKIQEILLFGRYLILSELGRGSGSKVYLARHQTLGEYRAIKQISKKSDFAWKVREARILNRLNHPKVPKLYDMEEDEDSYYMIEEYIEGESLEALLLRSSCITPDFIYQTITETASILNDMHHLKPNPLIYQDLKAEHIIIGFKGVKLIDFGISVFLGEPGNKFQNYGTPQYCAPEKSDKANIDIRTDIYSIGKLLEDLICADESGVSSSLLHIAKKASSFDPKQRYESMEAFQNTLAEHMQSKNHSYYQKHLLKKIVAAGSQPHIGTTHLSLSFTQYLNQQNIRAVYRENNTSDDLRKIIREGGFTKEGGLYRRGSFFGMPAYGEGVAVKVPHNAVEVFDFGTDWKRALLEEADIFLFLTGSRAWEREYASQVYHQVKDAKGLALISNYGDMKQAKRYASLYQQCVYCFPLDENPFLMTKEKERLFQRLLKEKGVQNQKHRNRRKYPWKRSHSLICSIGKLFSKRAW